MENPNQNKPTIKSPPRGLGGSQPSTAKNLCIIPARGGSKRIPRKNIRNFLGKPIIAYSIESALSSNLFDTVMVSTDDKEIARVAEKYGAEVPFMRTDKNADDFATTADVILEVIDKYRSKNIEFDNICCCYATAPFVSEKRLEEGFKKLNDKNVDSVFPIVEFDFPILRSLVKDKNNKVSFKWPEYEKSRSQDLEKVYHDAGQWYWMKINRFIDNRELISKNAVGLLLDSLEVQDIDTENDWKLAELKFKIVK